MKKSVTYKPVFFRAAVLREAEAAFAAVLPEGASVHRAERSARIGRETWSYDADAELYADYRRRPDTVLVVLWVRGTDEADAYHFRFAVMNGATAEVTVEAPTRAAIERVFHVFDDAEADATDAPDDVRDDDRDDEPPGPPTVFVGHGRSGAWRDLKDHLHEKHGYVVIAYETGARAGHTIRNVVEDMADASAFALLVLTAEDETADGGMRARQNVVHELGLFQGRLGYPRAVALLEEGTEEFSNLHGVQQIRFRRGGIAETFGEILATLRREFGDA